MNRPVSPTHFIAFPLLDWAGLFMDYLKKHFKWKTRKKHFQKLAWLIFLVNEHAAIRLQTPK